MTSFSLNMSYKLREITRSSIFLFFTISIIIGLVNCVSVPEFTLKDVDQAVTPKMVANKINTYKNRDVLWAGIIIKSDNIKKGTVLEVLAYPLENNFSPITKKSPLGRFIIMHNAYLETVDYEQGRALSVVGTINKTQKGMIGESEYIYPVIDSKQLHLWPLDYEQNSNTRFHFGLGISIH